MVKGVYEAGHLGLRLSNFGCVPFCINGLTMNHERNSVSEVGRSPILAPQVRRVRFKIKSFGRSPNGFQTHGVNFDWPQGLRKYLS